VPLRIAPSTNDSYVELFPRSFGNAGAPNPGDFLYVELSYLYESTSNQPNIGANIYLVEVTFIP
jgi:hypothetical protein